MPEPWARGSLEPASAAPVVGERMVTLLTQRNVVIEQILSSADVDAELYDQTQDEWVMLLTGAATLEILAAPEDPAAPPEPVTLAPGDWLFLPAHTRHRVVQTEPATTWLAIHVHP